MLTPKNINLFLRLSRPLYVLNVILLYILGTGIVRYLGEPVGLSLFGIGLIWLVSLQLSAHYLNDFFIIV